MTEQEKERWRVSDGRFFGLVLIGAALLFMLYMAVIWLPAMSAMFADFGGSLPWPTEMALSWYWLPAWIAVVLAMVFIALALEIRARLRTILLALALAISGGAMMGTLWAAYLPVFELAGAIEAD